MWERFSQLRLLPHQYPHKYGEYGVMYEEHMNALVEMKRLSSKRDSMEHDIAMKKAKAKSNSFSEQAF